MAGLRPMARSPSLPRRRRRRSSSRSRSIRSRVSSSASRPRNSTRLPRLAPSLTSRPPCPSSRLPLTPSHRTLSPSPSLGVRRPRLPNHLRKLRNLRNFRNLRNLCDLPMAPKGSKGRTPRSPGTAHCLPGTTRATMCPPDVKWCASLDPPTSVCTRDSHSSAVRRSWPRSPTSSARDPAVTSGRRPTPCGTSRKSSFAPPGRSTSIDMGPP